MKNKRWKKKLKGLIVIKKGEKRSRLGGVNQNKNILRGVNKKIILRGKNQK